MDIRSNPGKTKRITVVMDCLPCPFCGCKDLYLGIRINTGDYYDECALHCDHCACNLKDIFSVYEKDEEIEQKLKYMWNKRC